MSSGSVAAPTATSSPKRGRRHLTDRARSERRLAYMLVGPAVIIMLAVTAYPVIETMILSLQRSDLRFPAASTWVGLDNYGRCSARACGGRTCGTR